MSSTRREFLKRASAVGAGALVANTIPLKLISKTAVPAPGTKAIAISSANGMRAVAKAMEMIKAGADGLDAVIAGVNIVEDDPNDMSVGYGGLPNEDGVVELDASVMRGKTHTAGAVGALRNIKNPSKVARMVMERTDHVFLVGEGALHFAKAHGFKEEDLLTDRAREEWLKWKESLSPYDNWLPPHTANDKNIGEYFKPFIEHYGTIHCSAIDQNGDLSCVTTTSGLAWKLPGRVGDSAIIGAGMYVDNAVGSAGSTGRGEANLISSNTVMIVEWMRQGKLPEEACMMACRRIVENNKEARLQDDQGRPNFNVKFYALTRTGEHGCAGIYGPCEYAVDDGSGAKLYPGATLWPKQ